MAGRRWLLRCCLLLAAWQGPIPWWHCHGTLNAAVESEALSLAAHLRWFHGASCSCADENLGWHWHFLPGPTEEGSPDAPEQDQIQLPLRMSVDRLIESTASMALALAPDFACLACEADLPITVAGKAPFAPHFFAAFAPSLPLPMRFCVARC